MDETGRMASPAACHAPAESEPHAGGEVVVAGRRFSALFVGHSRLFPPQLRKTSLAHPPTLERVPMNYAG